jgi:membrane fusion protein (multidrug efflux system)
MRAVSSLALLSLLLLSACSGEDPAAGGPPGGAPPPMAVETIVVTPESLQQAVSTVGTLRADESVVMRPEINGRLVKIHFQEGQRVQQGDPLFTLDAGVAQAAVNEAQVNLASARRVHERASDLGAKQLLSQSEQDAALVGLSVSQARLASARAQLDKTVLVAPFGGVIGLREVSVGEVVSPGQALVNLVRLDPMEVDFSLPENELSLVSVGQPVTVVVDALNGLSVKGEVTAIEPVIDINTRSAKVRASVANPDYTLRPGLFARVTLGVGDAAAMAIIIPEQALLQQGDTRYVYLVRDGKAVRAEVSTGQRLPGRVAITSGLKAGDEVITAGQAKPMMFEGAAVFVAPSGEAAPEATAEPAPEAAPAPADAE